MNKRTLMALCKRHGVEYHHHDEFGKPRYSEPDLKDAVLLVYPSQYGHWALAVNVDGKVVKPGHSIDKIIRRSRAKIGRILKGKR